MNEPLDPFGRLLDDAAAQFQPTPDLARLERRLGGAQGRRRGAVMLFSAAACLALMGGAAVAFRSDPASRLAPAGDATSTEPTRTTEKRLEPSTTEKDREKEPTTTKATDPKPTEPKPTEPTAAPTTEPKHEPTTTEKRREEPPVTTKPPTTEPPKTDPPTTEPTWVWSANQVYGSCDSDPPYDVFYGTAKPGAKIVIEAAYGRKVGYANEAGNWEIHIEFPESPVGEPFQVWVVSGDHVDDFWFTRLA